MTAASTWYSALLIRQASRPIGSVPRKIGEMESSMSRIGWAGLLPELDRDSIVPLYRQIYEHLREAILAGTLPESTRLPPERTLAERLSVNRSTIVHAYRELVGDGLIEQRVGSGSRVVPQLRGGQPERAAGVPWWVTLPPWRVGEFPNVLGELAAKPEAGRISFVQGVAPDEPSPLGELAKSFERVARDPRFVLSYGDSEGYEPLRAAIAERMKARGATSIAPGSIIVLTGSTQGIAIVAQSLAEPGDEIIVESPSYPGALQVFQINGLRAISVPVDDDGMRVDHVEAVLRTRRPRFIYTMPALHNPTNSTMNADRRERLANGCCCANRPTTWPPASTCRRRSPIISSAATMRTSSNYATSSSSGAGSPTRRSRSTGR